MPVAEFSHVENVARHAAEDGLDLFESFAGVGADHECALAGVGGVHVGLGDGGVDELDLVRGQFAAELEGVEGGGGGSVHHDGAGLQAGGDVRFAEEDVPHDFALGEHGHNDFAVAEVRGVAVPGAGVGPF